MLRLALCDDDEQQRSISEALLRKYLERPDGPSGRLSVFSDPRQLLEEVEERKGIEKDGDGGRYAAEDGSWVHLEGKTLVSMNFWGFQRSFLDEATARFPLFLDRILDQDPIAGECYLPMLVTDMLSRGRAQVRMLSTADKWYGVTYREDKPAVVAALREKTEQGLYPENLWGV